MRHRRTTNENKMLSKMENMISMMATEKPFERLQSLEQKINEVDKIQTIENYIAQLKERIWAVKEVLTTAEASAYLGLSESYIYKLTSLKQIPHYKPNGKLVYFNRKELCEWAMRNQVQTIGQPAAITREELLFFVNSHGRSFDYNKEIKKSFPNHCYNLSKLDTSKITNMYSLFAYNNFNGDISNWDVSNVTNMRSLFYNSKFFNSNISNWNISNVTNMRYMFYAAINFNQLLNFNTSEVTNMSNMFYEAISFNQPLNFNTSNVTNMEAMFYEAEKFNSDIGNWDVSNVIDMSYIFANTKTFNQNISSWNLDNIKSTYSMFDNAKAFLDKYNSSNPLPNYTDEIKKWFNLNRDKMNEISIKDQHGEDIDDFFSNITDIYSTNRIGLHNNIHSLPISIP